MPVPLGGDVAAEKFHGAVCRLLGVRMHRLVREKERPGTFVPALDPLERHRVHEVGDVAAVLDVCAVVVEARIDDAAVAVVAHPGVVARPRHAVVSHVPLADVRGRVAEALKVQVIVRQPVAHRVARDVVDDAVAARVLSGENRGAIGRADRRRMERALEEHALVREAIHVRGLHVRMAARAELVVAQVVYQDHEKIRSAGFFHDSASSGSPASVCGRAPARHAGFARG